MASIELTPSQRSILSSLVNLYNEHEDVVKGETIAENINRNPGTIRNQMQSLKALQLVEGVPGPKGGYKPTPAAYDVLGLDQVDEPASVRVIHNGEIIDELNATQIHLTSLHHPSLCRAEIQIRGPLGNIQQGDFIEVGPTPISKLKIAGMVDGKDETNNLVILRIDEMTAPFDEE